MTRKESISILKTFKITGDRNHEAFDMAIKALEQKPCGDAISRREAIIQLSHNKIGDDDCDVIIQSDIETIKALPSVSPQQRTGRWIPVGYDGYADGNPVYDWWECSECGWEHTGDEESLTAFCPNCGAKMEVQE